MRAAVAHSSVFEVDVLVAAGLDPGLLDQKWVNNKGGNCYTINFSNRGQMLLNQCLVVTVDRDEDRESHGDPAAGPGVRRLRVDDGAVRAAEQREDVAEESSADEVVSIEVDQDSVVLAVALSPGESHPHHVRAVLGVAHVEAAGGRDVAESDLHHDVVPKSQWQQELDHLQRGFLLLQILKGFRA